MRLTPVLLLLIGCSAPSGTSSYMVSDSAGVQVVANAAPAWGTGSGWTVDPVPAVSIGQLDGDPAYQLGQLLTAAWLSGGRIAVGEESGQRIRVYGPDGRHLGDVGRVGDGPGEFRGLWAFGAYRGDSLYAYDHQTRRVGIWGPDLVHARGFALAARDEWYGVSDPLPDGRLVLHRSGNPFFTGAPGVHADSSLILLASPVGATLDTLGAFVVRQVLVRDGGLTWNFHLAPYGKVHSDGDRVAWYEGERLEFWQADLAGNNRRLVRAPHTPQRVDAAVIADFKRAYLELLGHLRGPEILQLIASDLAQGAYHHTLPAISDLRLDTEGNTWLGHYTLLPGRSTRWEVFDPRGVWLGTVATPSGLAVTAIGSSALLGYYQDADGVMSVRVHQIRKRS